MKDNINVNIPVGLINNAIYFITLYQVNNDKDDLNLSLIMLNTTIKYLREYETFIDKRKQENIND
jgi:hypothetical protein